MITVMSTRVLVLLFSLATVSLGGIYNDRSRNSIDYADYGRYQDEYRGSRSPEYVSGVATVSGESHTYDDRSMCEEVCEVACVLNKVTLKGVMYNMHLCSKLKPPKAAPFFSTLRGNSFYLTLFILAIIIVGIIILVTMCFCCSYCCRQSSSAASSSSRGSSKQALAHNEDGEFKEYLNGNGMSNGNGISHHDEIGAVKRERDFTRRPRPVPQIV